MPYWIQVLKWINGGMKKKKDMYFSDDVVSGQVIFLSDVLNMSQENPVYNPETEH